MEPLCSHVQRRGQASIDVYEPMFETDPIVKEIDQMAEKRVCFFGNGKAEGNATMKELLGGKGANLAEMTSLGVPVPPGFTIATKVCDEYYRLGAK